MAVSFPPVQTLISGWSLANIIRILTLNKFTRSPLVINRGALVINRGVMCPIDSVAGYEFAHSECVYMIGLEAGHG